MSRVDRKVCNYPILYSLHCEQEFTEKTGVFFLKYRFNFIFCLLEAFQLHSISHLQEEESPNFFTWQLSLLGSSKKKKKRHFFLPQSWRLEVQSATSSEALGRIYLCLFLTSTGGCQSLYLQKAISPLSLCVSVFTQHFPPNVSVFSSYKDISDIGLGPILIEYDLILT